MDRCHGGALFRGDDDLTTDLPDRDDRPAAQNRDPSYTNAHAAGPSVDGRLLLDGDGARSTSNAALEGIGRNPEGFAYDVSVVVFHKRYFLRRRLVGRELIASSPELGNEFDVSTDTMGDQERAVLRGHCAPPGPTAGAGCCSTDLGRQPSPRKAHSTT